MIGETGLIPVQCRYGKLRFANLVDGDKSECQ